MQIIVSQFAFCLEVHLYLLNALYGSPRTVMPNGLMLMAIIKLADKMTISNPVCIACA